MALPDELQPKGLLAYVERYGYEDQPLLADYFPPVPNDVVGPTIRWDVVDYGRGIAQAVSYDAPGLEVDPVTEEVKAVTAPTFREKLSVKGSHIQWLRASGERTRRRGQQAIQRQMNQLRARMHKRMEMLRADALSGSISYDVEGTTVTVSTHGNTDSAGVNWSTSSNDIIADLQGNWIDTVEQNAGVTPDTLIVGRSVLGYLVNNTAIQEIMGEEQKDRLRRGHITRIPAVDLDVIPYTKGYVNSAGTFTHYVGNDAAICCSSTMGQTTGGEEQYAWTVECNTPDAQAGEEYGLYMRSWETEEPPASVWVGAEWTGLPILGNNDAVAYDSDVTS